MKKWISAFICVSILIGCGPKEKCMEKDVGFEIRTDVFEQDDIKIQYPQIYGMEDEGKESRINEIIQNHVSEIAYFEPMTSIVEYDDHTEYYLERLEKQVECEITYLDEHMISILWQGEEKLYSVPWMASYDSYCIDGLTVDLDEMKKLKLNDFIEVDEDFVKKIKESTNILLAGGKIEMSQNEKVNIVKGQKTEHILSGFIEKGGYYKFCIAPGALLVSIDVGRLAGDYALIEIPN